MSQTIEIVVSPTGQTRVETKGFQGSTCRDAARFLAHTLGHVSGEQLTSEFYRPVETESVRPQRAQA